MPPEAPTVPRRGAGLPVRLVQVEVVSGPDAGRRFSAETDIVTIGSAPGNDVVLTDPTVSRFHLELRRQGDRIAVVDHGSTNGTSIGPVLLRGGTVAVRAGTVLDLGDTRVRLDDGNVVLLPDGPDVLGEVLGRAPAMRRLLGEVRRVAQMDGPVLLVGESGTGKELVARALHDAGPRSTEPFVVVDCAAIAPTLFASELFGHERGAFTGAERRHEGAFERAGRGTILLDEIGELPGDLQAALLGVLERRRMRRVGGSEEIPIEARVVSATHRDVRAAVNAGTFRIDLYYRLVVVLLQLPPLRDRREDVPLLVEHFLREAGFSGAVEDVFDAPAMEALCRHDWPGNVRELRNVVLGTLALGEPPTLGVRSARRAPSPQPPPAPETAGTNGPDDLIASVFDRPYKEARGVVVDAFERRYLTALLERSGGSARAAARRANMDRSYLMELLKRHRVR